MQLYAVALYVEEATATAALRAMDKQGFFTDYSEEELCRALLVGDFRKLLQIRLLRSVTYSQFIDEIGRDLKPRLDKSGDDDLWLRFADYFRNRSLDNGTDVLALWNGVLSLLPGCSHQHHPPHAPRSSSLCTAEDGSSEGGWFAPGTTDFSAITPTLKYDSPDFGRALFDVYAGQGAIVPDAKAQWAQSAHALLKRA